MSADADAPDFRTWIASLTTEQVEAGIAKAIRKHDWQAVEGLIRILVIKDPERAQAVYDTLCIATALHDRNAATAAGKAD